MKLYPHWLDGEYLRLATREFSSPAQVQVHFLRLVKIQALLGTELILSDVQLFDSPVVCSLFADPRFSAFVKGYRQLLDLRVFPDAALGESPFALAARGLTRSRAPGWLSSIDGTATTEIRRFAEEVLDTIQRDGQLDEDRRLRAEVDFPAHRTRFEAIRRAICYFGLHDRPEVMKSAVGTPHSYYSVLLESRAAIEQLVDSDRDSIELQQDLIRTDEAIAFVEASIPDATGRHLRSQAIRALDALPDDDRKAAIWSEIVQAWNLATQRTLAADGGTFANLLGNAAPGQYLERTAEQVSCVRLHGDRHARALPVLTADLDTMTWDEIGRALTAADSTLRELRTVRASGTEPDAYRELLNRHFAAITKALPPAKTGFGTTMAFQCVGVATGVAAPVALFGGSIADPAVVAVTGAAAKLAVDVAGAAWKDFGLGALGRAVLANTLSDNARRVLQHPGTGGR